jgi:Na+/H+-dicarboxylate symporter
MSKKRILQIAVIAIVLGAARLAFAQAGQEPATAATSSLLDTVVVTAGRGEETLRTVVSNFTVTVL